MGGEFYQIAIAIGSEFFSTGGTGIFFNKQICFGDGFELMPFYGTAYFSLTGFKFKFFLFLKKRR